jgi:hypothetical protein
VVWGLRRLCLPRNSSETVKLVVYTKGRQTYSFRLLRRESRKNINNNFSLEVRSEE